MRLFLICLLLLSIKSAYAAFDYECTSLESDSRFQIEKIYLTVQSNKKSELIISKSDEKEIFNDVECSVRKSPDSMLICEHDRLILIISTDENPALAVLNPFVKNGEELGPFYFTCE